MTRTIHLVLSVIFLVSIKVHITDCLRYQNDLDNLYGKSLAKSANISAPIDEYTKFQRDYLLAAVEFSYYESDATGPSKWSTLTNSAACGGTRQSPIDLNFFNSYIASFTDPLQIDGASQVPTSISVSNNGHSLVLKFNYANNFQIRFRKGPLGNDVYLVDSMHWHWGDTDFAGSEHTFNGLHFSAEGHIISYNSKYADFATAATMTDGLAVLSIFYNVNI